MAEIIYRPRGRAPERILLYGPQGSGKTRAACDALTKALGPGQTAYIVDTDNSYNRFLESGDWGKLTPRQEWEGGDWDDEWCEADGRVVLYHPRNWEDFEWCMGDAWTRAGRGDWVVVDSLTHPWADYIQTWYIERVHGSDLPEFLIEARIRQVEDSKGADGGSGAMLVEWTFVNKVWSKAFLTPYVNARSHVIVTAEAKTLRTDDRGDAKDIRDLYGHVGWKPDTQRRIGANSQTVVYMEPGRGKEQVWYATTVKDREREMLVREQVEEFGKMYLRGVAGWRPEKVTEEE